MVCKLKFSKLLDNKKDFRSKNFFGAEPRALKVEWVANFRISKSWFFLLWPKIFGTKYGFQSEFSHPTPRIGCQFSYAKEMRWIGPKMCEWEPFSWRRLKFLKITVYFFIWFPVRISKKFVFWFLFKSEQRLHCIYHGEGQKKLFEPPV